MKKENRYQNNGQKNGGAEDLKKKRWGKQHKYKLKVEWTGNKGVGTSNYTAYARSHIITIEGKVKIEGSSDPAFRGDATKHNPEELLLASISSCHMLWYLHLCAVEGIVVTEYSDEAKGIMMETLDVRSRFIEVTLHPKVVITDVSMLEKANSLHKKANELCFIANSLNFPVKHQPSCMLS